LVVGWVADIYHLIYRDIPPLLPALLPTLTGEVVDLQLLEAIISGYRQVYQSLEKERRYWMPELALQLARSLTHLPEKSWAREQIHYSLQSWLNLRRIQVPADGNLLEAMKPALTLGDREYLEKLQDCFTALEDERETARVQGLLEELTQTYPPLSFVATPGGEGNSGTGPFNMGKYSPLFTLREHSGKISSVAISPDGQTLVSGCLDRTIKIWNVHTGELLRTLTGHSEDISSVAISPDGQFLASSSLHCPKSNVKVWNLKSGKLLHNRLGHKKSARFVAIDFQARILVSASNKIKIWNLHTGDRLCTLWHSCAVNAAMISPDGHLLVSGSSDGKIKLWNPHTGDPLRTLTGHAGPVTSLVIEPDGQFLISGSVDKTIKIWHLETGKLQSTLKGHSEGINSLTISPDGRMLVSGSADKTIKIWHLMREELQHTLTGHAGGVNSVAISGDGRTLVSGSSDQTVKIWRVL
jgi:WD40 repeat protein